MSPDEVHLVLASAVIGAILLGALAMVVDAYRHPFCPDCYKCLKDKADREVVRLEKRHIDYHTWTDHMPHTCQARECPGRHQAKKKGR